jgi:hypothetical protein
VLLNKEITSNGNIFGGIERKDIFNMVWRGYFGAKPATH